MEILKTILCICIALTQLGATNGAELRSRSESLPKPIETAPMASMDIMPPQGAVTFTLQDYPVFCNNPIWRFLEPTVNQIKMHHIVDGKCEQHCVPQNIAKSLQEDGYTLGGCNNFLRLG